LALAVFRQFIFSLTIEAVKGLRVSVAIDYSTSVKKWLPRRRSKCVKDQFRFRKVIVQQYLFCCAPQSFSRRAKPLAK